MNFMEKKFLLQSEADLKDQVFKGHLWVGPVMICFFLKAFPIKLQLWEQGILHANLHAYCKD